MNGTGKKVKVKARFCAPLKSFLGGEREQQTAVVEQTAGPSSKEAGGGSKKGKKRPVKEEGEDDGRKDKVKKRRQDEEEEETHVAKKAPASGGKIRKGKEKAKKKIEEQEQAGDVLTDAEETDIVPREEEEERPESREGQEDEDEKAEDDSCNQSWVQCCKPECGKWRKLLPHTDPSELPRNWNCTMNIDPVYSSCMVSEEECDESEDYVIMSNLVPGSLVWAQQRGYPWWPAMIEADPDTDAFHQFKSATDKQPSRYHVAYLGEPVSRAWLPQSKVKPYMELTEQYVMRSASQGYKQKLKESIVMAAKAQKIPIVRRLEEFGFSTRRVCSESEVDSELQDAMEILLEKKKKAHFRKKKRTHKDKGKEEHKQEPREGKKRAAEAKPKKRSGGRLMKVAKKQEPYESPLTEEWSDGDQEESKGGKDWMETELSSDSY